MIDVRGEVKFKDKSEIKGYRQCSFDLVIFKEKKATYIIEVKNNKKEISKNDRQFKKYSAFNLPLYYCYCVEDLYKINL